MADEQLKLELRLKLLKDEINSQANTFDQIDSKTGVALGFTFVVVGQVLASVFRMATGEGHLQSTCLVVSYLTNFVFGSANVFAFLAIVFGAVSRWPRGFKHSISIPQVDIEGSHLNMLEGAVRDFGEIVSMNEQTLEEKGTWARWTYTFVGFTLLAYMVLTVLLYTISVTR